MVFPTRPEMQGPAPANSRVLLLRVFFAALAPDQGGRSGRQDSLPCPVSCLRLPFPSLVSRLLKSPQRRRDSRLSAVAATDQRAAKQLYVFLHRPCKAVQSKGLVGVNIHNGVDSRFILDSDPDEQFVTDETVNLLYSADGNKLQAFDILRR